jgi:UTP--glucose-1-phosphate uridylyltransferase
MPHARVHKGVIPAAGLGTRLLPATKVVPKELLPLIDVPVIQLAVDEARASGIDDLIVVTSRGKEILADHFDRQPELEAHLRERGKLEQLAAVSDVGAGVRFHYTRQAEPRGLGHAVLQAAAHVGHEPFAVLLPDDVMLGPRPVLAQLLDHWRPGFAVVAVMRVAREEAGRYGIVAGDVAPGSRAFRVEHIVEKPAPADVPPVAWAVMGRYVLDADVFDILETLPPGAGGEIQLTDALAELARAGRLVAVAYEGERYDMGDKLGYVKAIITHGLERPDFRDRLAAYLRSLADAGRF